MDQQNGNARPANKVGKVLGIGCAGIILLFILIAIITSNGSNNSQRSKPASKTEATSSKPAAAKPAKWVKIAVFQGSGTKKTPKFTVGSEWKVKWDTKPGQYGDMNFMVDIYKEGSDMPDSVANVIGKSKDESCQYDSGTYYLDINSGQPYIVEIWDKQ